MTKARTAVDQGSDEVRRARYWLEHDRRPHWENELKRRTRNLERAEQELLSAKYSEFNETQTMQRSAVRKAKEAVAEAEDKLRPSGRGVEGLTLGYWPEPLFGVFLAISSPVTFGDSLEVRDVAMPHGINTIHFKQGFQDPQFLVCHKGHGNP